MKTQLRGLTLTAMLLSASQMTLADDRENGSAVGDLPGYGEEAYFAEEATYAPSAQIAAARGDAFHSPAGPARVAQAAGAAATVGDLSPVGDFAAVAHQYETVAPEQYDPIGVQDLHYEGQYHGYPQAPAYHSGCDAGGCDGGCDSCSSSKSRFGRIGKMMELPSDTWASAEFLMWFVQNRDMPALITVSDPGTLPILPDEGDPNPDNVRTVFGDDIEGELSAGFRGDVGKFISERVGIGGRFWIIADNNDSYIAAGDGTDMSIGRPFFNTNIDDQDAVLVALDPNFTGSVAADSSLEMFGAEAYTRLRLTCSKMCRVDLLGGYSHFQVDDTLSISSTSIQTVPATGQTTTLLDRFEANNQFDGGQVGFELAVRRGRWRLSSLSKVHLGNMQQEIRIAGLNVVETPPAAPVVGTSGLLAQDNQGTYQRDKFAFIPEANIKLACQLRNNMMFSVGYSFLYFDNLALVGDVLDNTIDGTSVPSGPAGTRPVFDFDDSSLWVQGLDLGLSVNY